MSGKMTSYGIIKTIGGFIFEERVINMKLFGFAGTMHTPSDTAEIMERFSDELKKAGIIDTSVIVKASDVDVSMCKGCLSCYHCGKCVFDEQDDMARLKKEIIDSDIIVWGSPVYIHHVSGAMKNFIDRLVVWMYMYELVGKTAVTVSTATSNGNAFVDRYLEKVLKIMGANVAGKISVNMFSKDNEIEEQLNNCCESVKKAVANGITEPDPIQEEYYSATKRILSVPGARGFLVEYWKEHDMFKVEKYADHFNSYLGNRMKHQL